jgi:signal transduction histidine kinase
MARVRLIGRIGRQSPDQRRLARRSRDPDNAQGADTDRSTFDDVAVTPWPGRTALAFVLVTLTALVIVPVIVQQRVNHFRADIEATEPARTLVTRLQFSLAREMAALSELQLGGDTSYVRAYAAARANERAIYDELHPLAERLGPRVAEKFVIARTLARQWHEQADEGKIAARTPADTALLDREQNLFEQVLRAASAVDSAIVLAAADGRERIGATEQAGLRLTFVLGALALGAAIAVAWLSRKAREFAWESERRRLQAEAALAASARAQEARARLMRGVTHDVKNPLGAAKGYAELLTMGVKAPIHPEQLPLVEGVQRSVDAALAIIADLLDVARADSGQLPVNRVVADLDRVVADAVADHRAEADAKGLELHYSGLPDLRIYTDPARVQQVLGNLLSNAVKYTPDPGRIEVRVEAMADGARAGRWARIAVSDTGPGIPASQRDAIFDEFTRVDDGSAIKGHGLGLAIARRVARLLGGDLVLGERDGPGATFELWLPFRSKDDASAGESDDAT